MSENIIKFPVGTKFQRGRIIPVFIPFAGCPFKCLYCSQDVQTGASNLSIKDALHKLRFDIDDFCKGLSKNDASILNLEIAFYGGTFTALAQEDLELCLDEFQQIKDRLIKLGINLYGRCSTRPDCLGFSDTNYQKQDLGLLRKIRDSGIDLIELGIQSFDDLGLNALGRAYSGEIASLACKYVKENGFKLGIQLMPGSPSFRTASNLNLPFNSSIKNIVDLENLNLSLNFYNPKFKYQVQPVQTFLEDVEKALQLKPSCLRYYPFLVLDNTGFAKPWKEGLLSTWDLNTCINALGYALFRAWQEEISVIRLNLAFEEEFEKAVLAGVRHNALGSLVKARALLFYLNYFVDKIDLKKYELHLPKKFQGFLFGEKNFLKTEWNKIFDISRMHLDIVKSEYILGKKSDTSSEFAFFIKNDNVFQS